MTFRTKIMVLCWSLMIISEAAATLLHSRVGLLLTLGLNFVIGGLISSWFSRKFVNQLETISQHVGAEAEKTTLTSHAVSHVSTTLQDTSQKQATAITETMAAVDEVSAMIERNSENAAQSSQLSNQSKVVVEKGQKTVEQMLEAIHDIAKGNEGIVNQVEAGNREIGEIVKLIEEIGSKTRVINDIVFQTKLLSFNASVEAARAGEHGKGFAVVAEEVGNLAQMSGNAANEISKMLDSSSSRVQEIVQKMTSQIDQMVALSKDKIQTGTRVAEECSASLSEILSAVSNINEIVSDISRSSQEQTQGVQEISRAVNQLNEAMQETRSATHESFESSKALKNNATGLHDTVKELGSFISGKPFITETDETEKTRFSAKKFDQPAKLVPQQSNVIPLVKRREETKPKASHQKKSAPSSTSTAAPQIQPVATGTNEGLEFKRLTSGETIPSENDPRFVEV